MKEEEDVKELLNLLSKLNHRQWTIVKNVVEIAFEEKTKDAKVSFNKVQNLVCEDMLKNGI